MDSTTKKILVEICRILLGATFVFSGFIKGIDPWGGAYKIQEYLVSFGLNWLSALDLVLSFLLSALEFSVGVCLLTGVYRKRTTIVALVIMCFMTPLTLYIAIRNPVTDCGCFGDALIIPNWATFFKNIVLLVAAIYLFRNCKEMGRIYSRKRYQSAMLWPVIFILGFMFYSYFTLPIFDFRPYKIGANIPRLMEVPEDGEQPEYQTTLIYEKNGQEQEFSIDNYPRNDSTWTFVDSKSKLIKQGYIPPIHDFSITNSKGADITAEALSDPSYTFLLISKNIDEASDANISNINRLYDYSRRHNYSFYCLTASLQDDIRRWKEATAAEYPFCTTDETQLKTIIRSNPGLLLLKDGVILNKWSGNFIPRIDMNTPLENSSIGTESSSRGWLKFFFAFIIFIVPFFILFFYDIAEQAGNRRRHHRSKNRKGKYVEDFLNKTDEKIYRQINKEEE